MERRELIKYVACGAALNLAGLIGNTRLRANPTAGCSDDRFSNRGIARRAGGDRILSVAMTILVTK